MSQFVAHATQAYLKKLFARQGANTIPGLWLVDDSAGFAKLDASTFVGNVPGTWLTDGSVEWVKLASTSVLAALNGQYVQLTDSLAGHVTGPYDNTRIVLPSGEYINFDDSEDDVVAIGRGADGIRIGNPTGGNYLLIEADGTIKFVGDATVWSDLPVSSGSFDFGGAADPSLGDWQPGGSGATFKVYEFQAGEEAFFAVEVPYQYQSGEDLTVRLHWTPRGNGVAEAGNTVPWALDYSWSNGGDAFGASTALSLQGACSGTNHQHEVSAATTISGTGKLPGSILMCRIYRDGAGTWSAVTAPDSPAFLNLDFHFPVDTIGARSEGSK